MRTVMQRLVLGLALLVATPLYAQSDTPPPGARYEGRAYDFRRIADGVWLAVGTGAVSAESNNVIIETATDVIVVDAGTSPAAAWALLHELPRVTTKPVRYVVITHFHYDHAQGAQSFPPGVEVIGTEYTRNMVATGKSLEHSTTQGNRRFANTQIEVLTKALDTATTESAADVRRRRAVWEQYLASLATLRPVAPTVTVSRRMTIVHGEREVQVIHPGRAHTDGDLVVWLPKERILATGDLLQPSLPYMGDGYLQDWADVLDSLEAMRPAVVLPGHGDEFRDMAVIDRLADYMRTVWAHTAAAKAKGLTAEQANATLDLSRFERHYPRFPGWTDEMVVRRRLGTVQRAYQLLPVAPADARQRVDLLILGGRVLDGAGGDWVWADVGITGDRITFVGHAFDAKVVSRDTVNAKGLLVTPGLWDVHNHEKLEAPPGRFAVPFITQGVTTVVVGIDGFGSNQVTSAFDVYRKNGIAVNALAFVGHGPARSAAMGTDFARPATPAEIERMKAYVQEGMEQGAVGFSTGLAYNPGYYSTTAEVIELNKVAARYGGIYDTHDRDMGVSYKGIGFLNSVKEAMEIAEQGGTPLIFSHFNSLGIRAHPQMVEAIRLIERARARGVNVMGAGIIFTASESSVDGHLMPRWAPAGGTDSLLARVKDPATWARMRKDIAELLEIRGGPAKIVITEGPRAYTKRTLADIAAGMGVAPVEALRRMILETNGGRLMDMNLDIYSAENVRRLAVKDWMMTTVDGYTPATDTTYTHPRTYGGFTRKITQLVFDEKLITLPFAIRSMTSLPASFFGIPDRGLLKPGFFADIAIFDVSRMRANATYENPRRYSDGTVHVLVNGKFSLRDGKPTGVLAGQPILRGGR
jgi:N-acyl-D-amino-acid deacylase